MNDFSLAEPRLAKRRRRTPLTGRSRMHAQVTVEPEESFEEYEEIICTAEPTQEHEEETQLTPDVESAPPAKRPTRGGAERWTDAHDKQLIEIVFETLRDKKQLNDAFRRGCVEIDRKHDHAASGDKNRPCPACEDRWHRKLKQKFLPEPGSTSESDSESDSESESNHSECLGDRSLTPLDGSDVDGILQAWNAVRKCVQEVDELHPWNVYVQDHELYKTTEVDETPQDYIDRNSQYYFPDEEVTRVFGSDQAKWLWGQGVLSSFICSLLQLIHCCGKLKDDEYSAQVYAQLDVLAKFEEFERRRCSGDHKRTFMSRLIEKKTADQWIVKVRDDFRLSMRHRFSPAFYPKTNLPASSFSKGRRNEIRFYKVMHDALDRANIFDGSDFDRLAKGMKRSNFQDFYYYPRLDALYKSIEEGK
jgi:hypothetical protein